MSERETYPSERALHEAREEQAELRAHVAYPGRVQSYDPATQAADIVPLIRQQVPQPDGVHTMEELPVLPSVPVLFPRMGAWFLSFPVAPGDIGQILVQTSAIGHWRAGNGDVTDPGDLRRQHLSHAVFLPMGLVPRSQALQRTGDAGTSSPPPPAQALPTGLVLGNDGDGPRLLLRANGGLDIVTGGNTVLHVEPSGIASLGAASGQFVALANLVNQTINELKSIFDAWSPVPNDGGAALKTALATWSPTDVSASRVKAT